MKGKDSGRTFRRQPTFVSGWQRRSVPHGFLVLRPHSSESPVNRRVSRVTPETPIHEDTIDPKSDSVRVGVDGRRELTDISGLTRLYLLSEEVSLD